MSAPIRHHPSAYSSSGSNSQVDLNSSGQSSSFLCTICWQHQPEHHKPKLLGTSARIVCQPCWRAVLDLSICWVCGECIVRGAEVVSLGWCFWHRACFGCLVCGTRMNINNEATWDGKGLGVELEEAPLCVICDTDMTGEKSGVILKRGIEMVSRFDGGLSRDRMGMLANANVKNAKRRRHGRTRSSEDRWVAETRASKSRSSSGSSKRSRRAIRSSELRWDFTRDIYTAYLNDSGDVDDLHSLLDHAADMGISEDGTAEPVDSPDELESPNFRAVQSGDERREIYVSVFDPFGQPTFRPSKTKPLPKWMHLLPSNPNREGTQRANSSVAGMSQRSAQAKSFRRVVRSELRESSGDDDQETQRASFDTVEQPKKARLINSTTSPIDIPIKKQATVSFDTTIPSPRIDRRRPPRGQSIYMTPPEYPAMISAPRRQKTPFPALQSRPTLPRKTSHTAIGNDEQKLHSDSCCKLTDGVEPSALVSSSPERYNFIGGEFTSPGLTAVSSLAPSSEYLQRYRPKQAESRSPTYVAKEPEPILAKMKRQRMGKQSMEKIAGDLKKQKDIGGRKIETLGDEESSHNPRHEDLQKELKILFCED